MNNIYLIGLMGSGKTVIGRELAKKIHRKYVDTDDAIEKKLGMKVPEIFSQLGEEAFRNAETQVIAELAQRRNRIISTGGGAALRRENVKLMQSSGLVVWIKRDIELILRGKRIRCRPLLADDPNRIYAIAAEREPIYAAACHAIVENNSSKEETVAKILKAAGR
ncbi:MAG: shikimate kinase [Bacillota bacterium]|nr:shikimate kinase [Bacillota bacterium]